MRNILIAALLLFSGLVFSQSANGLFDNLRVVNTFRIGAPNSQKITGFDLGISGSSTNAKLPTSKAVWDYIQGACMLNGATAGGDLSGAYPSPLVIRLQGYPVANTAPTSGKVLKWNGTAWAPGTDDNTDAQTLSRTGQTLAISGGNNISLPVIAVAAGSGISVSNSGGTATVTNTGDLSTTNELQTISLSGSDLTLSNGGGTVTLPSGGGGGAVATVTGISVDNTDATNPVVNAIPMTDPFSDLVAYGGNLNWRTDAGFSDAGIKWDKAIDDVTGDVNVNHGGFVWYSDDGSGQKNIFQVIPGNSFVFGTSVPGQGNAKIESSANGINIIANEFSSGNQRYLFFEVSSGFGNTVLYNSNGGYDFQSTTGAILPPRMTTTQRNALSTLEGMMIYNTDDHKFQVYDGSTWQDAW